MAANRERVKGEPGIYRRGSRFVVLYRDPDGRQRQESARSLQEARRKRRARMAAVDAGEYAPQARVRFAEYAREWIERYTGRGRRGFRENTRTEHRRLLEQCAIAYFGERVLLAEITPVPVAAFVGWLCDPRKQAEARHALAVKRAHEEDRPQPKPLAHDATRTLSDSTIRNAVTPLRSCLATAVREGLIRANPARDIDLPHRPTAEQQEVDGVKALTHEELATLIGILPDQWTLFFRFMASTGLRVSEQIALQWRHLLLDGSTPHVKIRRALVKGKMDPPKSRHGRRQVPLDADLVSALRAHRKGSEWPADDNLVFPAANGSALMPGNVRRRVLAPAREEACLAWVGFHTFRHTAASLLFAEGRSVVQVQHFLGHHAASFTLDTYIHMLSDGDVGGPLVVGAPRLGHLQRPDLVRRREGYANTRFVEFPCRRVVTEGVGIR